MVDRPVVWVAVMFAAGIGVAGVVHFPYWLTITAILTFLFLSSVVYYHKLDLTVFILILCFLAGALAFQVRSSYRPADNLQIAPLMKTVAWCSQQFNEVLNKILPQKEASLLGSILLGSSVSPLPDDLQETYRKAGLIHLLVVSGTQVSILIGICLAVTRSAGLPLWLAVLITSFLNLTLVVMTGAGASILRAAIMGEITLVGLLFERQKEFYTSLALSAFILLIADPRNLFDIGFQLSFAATWALVYIVPALEKKVPTALAICLAPILATMPIIAFNFGQISFGAVLSNLLVLPWVEILVIMGMAATIIGFIFLPLAQVMGNAIWLLLTMLDGIAAFVAALPGACFYIKAPSLLLVISYYAGLVFLISFKITPKKIVFCFFLFITFFVWDGIIFWEGGGLTVTFLDVGQGDSILIETVEGKKILVDGGGSERWDVGAKVVVPFLRRKGINKLDLVVLTHPHEDHIGGLLAVLKELKVDQVLDSGQSSDSRSYRIFKALIQANRIKYSLARAGQSVHFGNDLEAQILNPIYPFIGEANSDSIVMRLVYGKISFLLTGDLDFKGEQRMALIAQSTFLKVGHHGSSTSTSAEFLKAVAPAYAVISVGERNKFRHPALAALKRLESAGVKYYRADRDGTVVVRTDGRRISVQCRKLARYSRTRSPASGWPGPDRGPRRPRRG